MEFTKEMLEKAMLTKSAEELLELAHQNGINMTAKEAEKKFARLNPPYGELNDDELDNVAGGGCGGNNSAPPPSRFEIGDYPPVPSEYFNPKDYEGAQFYRAVVEIVNKQYKNGEWHYNIKYRGNLISDVPESKFQ